MFLIDEEEMVAKKKYNEGKIDLETLNQILGRNTEEDDDENRDITEQRNFNLLFTGALKEDVLKQLNWRQKINHFPFSFNIGRKDAMWKNYQKLEV